MTEANCHKSVLPDRSISRGGRQGGQADRRQERHRQTEGPRVSLAHSGLPYNHTDADTGGTKRIRSCYDSRREQCWTM